MNSKRKKVLGKGLAALIPNSNQQTKLGESAADLILGKTLAKVPANISPTGIELVEIPIADIFPNPKQPREVFAETELNELAHSIKEFGLLQPIVVRVKENQNSALIYELVMGERRLRAAKLAGLQKISAIVKQTDDHNLLRDALIENIHRVQLNPLEEAAAYQQLLSEFQVTQEELAKRLGRSRSQITNTIRLLKLPLTVQQKLAAGLLSAGHARALLSLTDSDKQIELAEKIITAGWSVRVAETEALLLNSAGTTVLTSKIKRKPMVMPRLLDLSKQISELLNTQVKIGLGKRKGKITIDFGSVEDLERIYNILIKNSN